MKQVIILKKTLILLLFLSFLFTLSACQRTTTFPNPSSTYCVSSNDPSYYKCDINWTSYFDTRIILTVYINSETDIMVEPLFEEVRTILSHYHELFDKYNGYEGVVGIHTINQSADTFDEVSGLYGKQTISTELFQAIEYALVHEDIVKAGTVSLFNIALGPVLEIWHDLREQSSCTETLLLGALVCPTPDPEIFNQSFAINPKQIVLNESDSSIGFQVSGMRLDLGGYAKGYVAEIITDYLDTLDIPYILNAGSSNVKAGGINPNTTDGFYYIGLQRPMIGFSLESQLYSFVKMAEGLSIVTSGNYQRYFIGFEDDQIYHHIIDPRTYYPGGDTMAVSVFHEDGAIADILSTAVYLLGLEDGLLYVNQTEGLEAVWYLSDGTIVVSNGLQEDTFQYQGKLYPIYSLK